MNHRRPQGVSDSIEMCSDSRETTEMWDNLSAVQSQAEAISTIQQEYAR